MYQVLSIMYKGFKKYFPIALFILATYYILHTTVAPAQAQIMSNQDYTIDTTDINEELQPKTQKPDSAGLEGVNFNIKKGFENLASAPPFSISLSSDLIDFGILSPTNPIIRTVDLSIANPPPYGYSVVAFENHSLKNNSEASQQSIPDTTCDNGQCNEKNADEWTNTLTYGFGYRCDNLTGTGCDSSFSDPNFYKHFANASIPQSPQAIISATASGNKTARISYKVNIPPTIEKGIYSNAITYVAIPNF